MKLVAVIAVISVACVGAVSGCPDQLDLAFVIDGSGSVGTSNWMVVQDFLVDVIMRFRVGGNNVRVGMVTYSSTATTQWNLGGHETFNASSLANALGRLRYPGGNTATPVALRHARSNVITASGSRGSVPDVVVVITDGKSNVPRDRAKDLLRTEANALKRRARVVVIGVGSINREELRLIASSSCDVFKVNDFSQMNDNMAARMDQICGCMPGHMRSGTCQCVACQMDMYQPDWGQTDCLACPANFTAMSSMASMQCIRECPVGSKIDSTGQRCMLCPQNHYQLLENQDHCIPCESGKATRGPGATSEDQCETICEAGQQPNQHGGCDHCPVGTYQPSAFSTMCIPCPGGFSTHDIGSTRMSQCIAICNSGSFAGPDNMCMACPIGTYQDMTLAEVCAACPNGTSTRTNGSMSVGDCKVVCSPGQHADEDGMECIPCDKGYYQPEEFMQLCIKCPSGTDTPREGMTACQRSLSDTMTWLIVGLVLFLVLLVLVLLLYCWRKRAHARSGMRADDTAIKNVSYSRVTAMMEPSGMMCSGSEDDANIHSPEPNQMQVRKESAYDKAYAGDEKGHGHHTRAENTYDSNTCKPEPNLYINSNRTCRA